ncbi:MAG: hypothetical protein V3573_14545 [Desulfovibrionaceae bacterium]
MSMIETQIATRVVNSLLDAGYTVGVNDGEEITVRRSTDRTEIMAALETTDEDYILAYDATTGRNISWVWLVWGNDEDLITDYTVNLEPVVGELIY